MKKSVSKLIGLVAAWIIVIGSVGVAVAIFRAVILFFWNLV